MSTLDRRRPELNRSAGGNADYVSVPGRHLLISQIAVICLIVLGTVCLSGIVLYFAVVRPVRNEVVALHADHQAMKAELEKMRASLTSAQTKLDKVDGIQGSLTRIEQQLRDMQNSFERRISSREGRAPWEPNPTYAAGFGGGGGSGSSGCGGALVVLVLLLILGGLAGGGKSN